MHRHIYMYFNGHIPKGTFMKFCILICPWKLIVAFGICLACINSTASLHRTWIHLYLIEDFDSGVAFETSIHCCLLTHVSKRLICQAGWNEEYKPFGKDTTSDLTQVHVPTSSVNQGNMPGSVRLPTGVRGKVQPANAAAPLPPSQLTFGRLTFCVPV